MYSKAVEMLDKFINYSFNSEFLDKELVDWINSKALDDFYNCTDELACLPFWNLCLGGHLELAKFYYDKYIKPEEESRESVLINLGFVFACKGGHFPLAKWLVNECQASAFPGGMRNACENGRYEVAMWLLDNHVEEGEDFLEDACRGGNLEIVKVLWERFVQNIEDIDDSMKPFNIAVYNGHLEVAKFLVEKSPAVIRNFSWLSAACQQGHIEIVKWFIECYKNRVSIYYVSKSFNLACSRGHLEIAKLLFSAYPDLNPHNEDASAFRNAKANGHAKVVEWLLDTFYKV